MCPNTRDTVDSFIVGNQLFGEWTTSFQCTTYDMCACLSVYPYMTVDAEKQPIQKQQLTQALITPNNSTPEGSSSLG